MRDYSSQREEIETIKPRTITVNLSDADVRRLAEKSGEGGLTISELLENFIGDLVDGTYSNGSDERMYAEQWYQRCWFAMFSDDTFLKFLLLWGDLDDYIDLVDELESNKKLRQRSMILLDIQEPTIVLAGLFPVLIREPPRRRT